MVSDRRNARNVEKPQAKTWRFFTSSRLRGKGPAQSTTKTLSSLQSIFGLVTGSVNTMIKGTCSPAGDPGRGSSQKFATNFTNYTKTFVEFVAALLGVDATGCVVTDERGDLIHHRIFGLVYLAVGPGNSLPVFWVRRGEI